MISGRNKLLATTYHLFSRSLQTIWWKYKTNLVSIGCEFEVYKKTRRKVIFAYLILSLAALLWSIDNTFFLFNKELTVAGSIMNGICGIGLILWMVLPPPALGEKQACKLKCRLRELTSCFCTGAVCFEGRVAGLDVTDRGNELFQPSFEFTCLLLSEEGKEHLKRRVSTDYVFHSQHLWNW